MTQTRGPSAVAMSKALLTLSALVMTAGSLAACSEDRSACQSGAGSAVGAVEQLLNAASTGDVEAACAVSTPVISADLESHLGELAALVEEGGVESFTIQENPQLQMGSGYVVEVTAPGATTAQRFDVLHNSQRYLVVVPGTPPPPPAGTTPSVTPSTATTPLGNATATT